MTTLFSNHWALSTNLVQSSVFRIPRDLSVLILLFFLTAQSFCYVFNIDFVTCMQICRIMSRTICYTRWCGSTDVKPPSCSRLHWADRSFLLFSFFLFCFLLFVCFLLASFACVWLFLVLAHAFFQGWSIPAKVRRQMCEVRCFVSDRQRHPHPSSVCLSVCLSVSLSVCLSSPPLTLYRLCLLHSRPPPPPPLTPNRIACQYHRPEARCPARRMLVNAREWRNKASEVALPTHFRWQKLGRMQGGG